LGVGQQAAVCALRVAGDDRQTPLHPRLRAATEAALEAPEDKVEG